MMTETHLRRAAFTAEGGGVFIAKSFAAGPWSAEHCHGGAPAALAVRVVEAIPTIVPMELARLTCELMRPVPLGQLEVKTTILREGKKLQLVEISMSSKGVEVVRGTALRLRAAPQPELSGFRQSVIELPPFEAGLVEQSRVPDRFTSLFTLAAVKGNFREAGPAALWFRLEDDLIAGESASGTMRAVAAADFTNGISTPVPFTDWTFLNADLTVSFARQPIGDAILVDGATLTGGTGHAVAHSRLGDEVGWFGHATQSLLLERRP